MAIKLEKGVREFFTYSTVASKALSLNLAILEEWLAKEKIANASLKWQYYVPFGDSDVLLVLDGFTREPPHTGLLDLRLVNSLRAFRVKRLAGANRSEVDTSSLNALIFLKLKHSLPSRGRWHSIEASLLPILQEFVLNHPDVNIEVLATLGWHEIILRVNFHSLTTLGLLLTCISGTDTHGSCGKPGDYVCDLSFTMIMVKCHLTTHDLAPAIGLTSEDASGTILLDVRRGQPLRPMLQDLATRLRSKARFFFGAHDFLVPFDDFPLNALFGHLMEIRKQYCDILVSTKTILTLSMEPSQKRCEPEVEIATNLQTAND